MNIRPVPAIVTSYDPPPIPIRKCDWTAVFEDYDGGMIDHETPSRDPVGYGATEDEAINDLMDQWEDRE